MTSVRLPLAILLALAGLSACAGTRERGTQAGGGLEVTRFHLGGVVASGEVVIEPRFAGAGAPRFAAEAAAVATELRRLGFTPGDRPGSEFIATVDVSAGTPVQLQARAPARPQAAPTTPVTPGVAAATGNQAQLDVELKRRSDGSIVWEGNAREPLRAGTAVPPAVVSRLASALFRDFPGESGRTIRSR